MKPISGIILFVMVSVATASDYCNMKSCNGAKHIGCNNNGAWSSECPSDAQIVPLNNPEKNIILAKHNERRNFVAGGGVPHLSAACRMPTMTWNDELAKLAELNVRQCKMNHDSCHNTDTYDWSGQNLAWGGYFDPLNLPSQLNGLVDMWYNEVNDTKQAYIDKYPQNYNGPTIGHFTVFVSDRNVQVGCAAAKYSVKDQSYKALLLACNYATHNIVGIKMYSSCSKGASGCKTGTNPSYSNLCSINEKYTPNDLSV